MAPKRKASDDAGFVPLKTSRISAEERTPDQDSASDDSGDFQTNYTDTGARRADSEARRQWHYVCPVVSCAQRFNRPCRLESHIRSHNKERPFACTQLGCDKTFPRKDHLQRHIKNAHSDPAAERTYTCDWRECGKSFTSNGRLQRHRDVHDSKFYCTEFPPCNEHFRKPKALEAHIKSQHLEVKPYPCTFIDIETGDKCTSGFETEGTLHRHMSKVHSKAQVGGHICMLCVPPGAEAEIFQHDLGKTVIIPSQPLSFATNEELAVHTKECHPPVCSVCGLKFRNTSSLKAHFNTVHLDPTSQPQFPCPNPNCDSVFNRKHNLTVHIQTVHEQQIKYFCNSDALHSSKHEDLKAWNGENACGAAFKAKSSLDQHVRTHHLGLGTRKQLRMAAKSKKKPDPSMLTLLTGVGYEQGREIPCLVKTCEYRFYRDLDLRRHLCATHDISRDESEAMIQERDAMTGGQFWIGGLDESINKFESVEPSMPHTPAPYFFDGAMPLPLDTDGQAKSTEPHFDLFNHQFDSVSLLDADDAQMDMVMELNDLAPATNVQEGLLWDTLAPVEHFNHNHG